jgi:pimeloyl-ACP methyl ester carboxylesterase
MIRLQRMSRVRVSFALGVTALAFVAAGCGGTPQPTALDRLHPCKSEEGPTDAYCGTLSVFENRDAKQGRKIDLKIVVLPALGNDTKSDPFFFLAGGPGQGAAEMARQLRDLFRRVQTSRDIVLVDQRGTGKSHPLTCTDNMDRLTALGEPEIAGIERIKKCLAGYDADPRMYLTTIAMDDLNEVRTYLGYNKINIYGGSYGTRAALVYLRRHEPTVRSVILDGVAPTDMRLPLFFARDAQRALDLLLAHCEADQPCRTAYPNLAQRLRTLLERLEKEPVTVKLVHPRTGIAEDVPIRASFVVGSIFGALYAPIASSLIPALIERAERHDFQGMLALSMLNEMAGDNMAVGMQMSVLCAEDHPRITPEDAARESGNTVFRSHLIETRMKVCAFWPKGDVLPDYYKPVTSSVPVLVLSGELDPVTPPSWGELAAKTLTNSRHLIAPGTGHGVLTTACGPRLLQEFLESASPQSVNDSCLKGLKRPPFFLTPSGPDPLAASGGGS